MQGLTHLRLKIGNRAVFTKKKRNYLFLPVHKNLSPPR